MSVRYYYDSKSSSLCNHKKGSTLENTMQLHGNWILVELVTMQRRSCECFKSTQPKRTPRHTQINTHLWHKDISWKGNRTEDKDGAISCDVPEWWLPGLGLTSFSSYFLFSLWKWEHMHMIASNTGMSTGMACVNSRRFWKWKHNPLTCNICLTPQDPSLLKKKKSKTYIDFILGNYYVLFVCIVSLFSKINSSFI